MSWDDFAYVSATVVDGNGVIIPNGDAVISFTVVGAGKIVAVDSGDNSSHEPFQAAERQAFQGRCFAIVRVLLSPAQITVTASSPGLANGSVTISAVR